MILSLSQFGLLQSFKRWLSLAIILLLVLSEFFLASADTATLQVTILPALNDKNQQVQQQVQQQQQQNVGLSIVHHSISVGGGGGGKNKNKNKNKGKGPKSVGISLGGDKSKNAPAPAPGTAPAIAQGPNGPAPAPGSAPAIAQGPNGLAPAPGAGPSIAQGPNGPGTVPPKAPQPGVKTFLPVLAETKTVIQNSPHVSEAKVEEIVELKQEGFKNIREIKSLIQGILEEKKALQTETVVETVDEGGSSLAADFSSVISDVVSEDVNEESSVSSSDSSEEIEDLDYEDHWAETYIEVVKVMDLAQGKDDEGNFEPNQPITRAEFVKMTINAMGYEVADSVTEAPFTDVELDDWYAPYLSVGSQVGLIEGFDDGSFDPKREVTRAEVLKVLVLGVMDVEFEMEKEEDVLERFGMIRPPFVDLSVEKWYAPYVLYSSEVGLVNGYDDFTFRPNSYMTRAELSKVLVETLEYVYSEDERLSVLTPLQLSEEGLEPGVDAALDSEHDTSLWKRIRRWTLQKSFWR